MSNPDEFTKLIYDKFITIIYPQITQITNSYSIQYINTGDRIKDNAAVIILNTLVAILFTLLYYICEHMYSFMMNKDLDKNVLNVNEIIKYHPGDIVEKYNFIYKDFLYFSIKYLLYYLNENNIIDDINVNEKTQLTLRENFGKINSSIHDGDLCNVFIPVYKYKSNNNIEYIFLKNKTLYSKNEKELSSFIIKILHQFCKQKNTISLVNISNAIFEFKNFELIRIGYINKNHTFDKMFFDNKKYLLKWVDKFKTKTLYPPCLPLTNKLGILLYGPPGTGKTGCVTALANYLDYNVILINSLDLIDSDQMKLIQFINNNKTSNIFVFDEIDYLLNNKKEDKDNINYQELLLLSEGEERKEIMKNMKDWKTKNSQTFDFAFFLKLLDGMGCDDNRIIIATTNHPEKINPLLLRPGRFDIKLKLGYCSLQMMEDLISLKYPIIKEQINQPPFHKKLESIIKLNITPVILVNKLVQSESFDELIEILEGLYKSEDYKNLMIN
jgi:hypothetical protein